MSGPYLRQIILSQLYFWASCRREGSMMPPRRRSTRCRVDSGRETNISGHRGGCWGPPGDHPVPPGGAQILVRGSSTTGTFLDVVVGERAAILQLLAREDQPLLVGGDP